MLYKGRFYNADVQSANNRYINKQKKKIIPLAIDNISILRYVLDNKLLKIADVDYFLNGYTWSVDGKAMLMQYRDGTFIKKQKEIKLDKDMGLKQLSVADLKRMWKTKNIRTAHYLQRNILARIRRL